MLFLEISDIRKFTNELFLGDLFDSFYLCDADFITFAAFHLDGRLQLSYFDTEEQKDLEHRGQVFSLWKNEKPFCLSLVRGKRLPLRFRITFAVPNELLFSGSSDSSNAQESCYLNIQYRDQKLFCTTGVSLHTFIPGIRPEQAVDDFIRQFFTEHDIAYEQDS